MYYLNILTALDLIWELDVEPDERKRATIPVVLTAGNNKAVVLQFELDPSK